VKTSFTKHDHASANSLQISLKEERDK